MSKTVLVTGATGFVAGWCIARLIQQGFLVRSTVRSLSKEAAVRAAVGKIVDPGGRLSLHVADLISDPGWDQAMAGCDYVLHVASPLGGGVAGDRHSLVPAARDGTLRVLRSAVKAGVKRVVMTSAAATTRPPLELNRISDETVWADPEDPQFDAYRVSKILAERAAWDFMRAGGSATELTTILPGAVFGPILSDDNQSSVQIIAGLLRGRPALVPQLGFWVVDVRDLADLHITAMTSPEAAGERFIAANEFVWMADIGRMLRDRLGSRGAKAATRVLPNFLVRVLVPFMPQLKTLAPLIGRRFGVSTEKARRVLGFSPRPAVETVVDCAESLIAAPGR